MARDSAGPVKRSQDAKHICSGSPVFIYGRINPSDRGPFFIRHRRDQGDYRRSRLTGGAEADAGVLVYQCLFPKGSFVCTLATLAGGQRGPIKSVNWKRLLTLGPLPSPPNDCCPVDTELTRASSASPVAVGRGWLPKE